MCSLWFSGPRYSFPPMVLGLWRSLRIKVCCATFDEAEKNRIVEESLHLLRHSGRGWGFPSRRETAMREASAVTRATHTPGLQSQRGWGVDVCFRGSDLSRDTTKPDGSEMSSGPVRSRLSLRQIMLSDHPWAAWAAWSGTVAPHAAHFLFNARAAFHRPALPEPASVPGPAPTVPRVSGDAAQRPPGAGALPHSPLGTGARPSARRTQPAAATVHSCGHAPAQLRGAFAFAPPLPPLPSLSAERRPSGSQAPCRFIVRPRVMPFSPKCLSLTTVSNKAQSREGCFPNCCC